MRSRGILLAGIVIALSGCRGNTDPGPRGERQPGGPDPKVVRHKLDNNLVLNLFMEREVPGVLELDIANSGGPGDVRVWAEQGKKRWEERAHFGAGEQRTVRVSLPGADDGFVIFGAQAVPPAAFFPGQEPKDREAGPRAGGFWGRLWEGMLVGAFVGVAAGLLVALVKRLGRQKPPRADAPPAAERGTGGGESCSICGARLHRGEIGTGLCTPCQKRAAGR
jgi:hypothetical protein